MTMRALIGLPELAESILAPLMMVFPEVSSAAPTRNGGCPGLLYAYSLPIGGQRSTSLVSMHNHEGPRHSRAHDGLPSCPAHSGRTFEGCPDETVLIFDRKFASYSLPRRTCHDTEVLFEVKRPSRPRERKKRG